MDQKLKSASHSFLSDTKKLLTAFGCLAVLCCLTGFALTVVLLLADNVNPQTGQERAIDNMLNAFSYLIPLVTAVLTIALLLAGLTLWHFSPQQEDA